jgi:hypothetical protein
MSKDFWECYYKFNASISDFLIKKNEEQSLFDRFVRRELADMIPESLLLSPPFISKFFVRL